MWGLDRKPAVMALSKKVTFALAKEHGLTDESAASLRMVNKRGHYDGRRVTYFHVFDPANIAASGIKVDDFSELHAGTMLYRGHVERDGQIVVNQ